MTSSGAAALWIALEGLKQRNPGRRFVIIPAFTCPLVALAVRQAGLVPRLCDNRPGHFDLDPVVLRRLCDEDTLAVVATHLAGRVADLHDVSTIARAAGASVIEDAAQAMGARSSEGPVGSAGDVSIFSLGAGKGLSIYAGGFVVAKDPALQDLLGRCAARLAPPNPWLEAWRAVQTLGLWAAYRPLGLWFAYGLPLRRGLSSGDLVGALSERFSPRIKAHQVGAWRRHVARSASDRLAGFLSMGRRRAGPRIERLNRIRGIRVLQDREGCAGTWPCFLLLLPDEASRDRALSRLWSAGLGVSRAFCHALPDYPEMAGVVEQTAVPNARDFAARTLTVTNSHWLREDELERICLELERATSCCPQATQAGSDSK
jgi:dTDP-4-amino-4,6-dideoxygalactose transaminase